MNEEKIKNAWDKINPNEEKKQRIMRKIYEAQSQHKRGFSTKVSLIVAIVASLTITTVFFAEPIWRYLETRIVKGGTYIDHFIVREYGDERIFDISGLPEMSEVPIVVEVEGEQLMLIDSRKRAYHQSCKWE